MGAKQSKRSVDISGKEAEGAGEVAAAGAGGEGRMEQLADADALKPQTNGDAHIHEQTEKEKQLDSGTPENEKDATTEKEEKQEDEKDKEAAPAVTNGESEQKVENGDSTPTPEDGKKPKKEKVKKKWSLRSISFSRKDKPKQEKKSKEEEPKTNGEPEKVPEETADATTPESPASEVAEEAKVQTEVIEEKTPETPVTEPITNGSSTSESPKDETPVTEEVAPSSENDRPESKVEPEPEQLPVNGLSLEEPKKEIAVVEKCEERKPEEPTAETTETAPATETSVEKEVCVDQMPLIESTPPPLPANPPPSSVASFAATTMAPELTDASLANPTQTTTSVLPAAPESKDKLNETSPEPQTVLTNIETDTTELPPPLKEINGEAPSEIKKDEVENIKQVLESPVAVEVIQEVEIPIVQIDEIEIDDKAGEFLDVVTTTTEIPQSIVDLAESVENLPLPPPPKVEEEEMPAPQEDDKISTMKDIVETKVDSPVQNAIVITKEIVINTNHAAETNGIEDGNINDNETEQENFKNKIKDSLENVIETIECNGNIENVETTLEVVPIINTEDDNVDLAKVETTGEDSLPPSLSEAIEATNNEDSDSFPLPPSEACHTPPTDPQDPLPVPDKLAELIPEIPAVPELKTETLQETTTDVAVAN